MFVADVQKAKQFYQNLFGMPVLTNQDLGVTVFGPASVSAVIRRSCT